MSTLLTIVWTLLVSFQWLLSVSSGDVAGVPFTAPNTKDGALKTSILNRFNNQDLSIPKNVAPSVHGNVLKNSYGRSSKYSNVPNGNIEFRRTDGGKIPFNADEMHAHNAAQAAVGGTGIIGRPGDDDEDNSLDSQGLPLGRKSRNRSPLIEKYMNKKKTHLENMMYFGNGLNNNNNNTKKGKSSKYQFSSKREWEMLKDLLTDYRPPLSLMKETALLYKKDSHRKYGRHYNVTDIPIEIQPFAKLTMDESYDALYVHPRKHEYNWMIGKLEDIEFILPENDEILFELLGDGLNTYVKFLLFFF